MTESDSQPELATPVEDLRLSQRVILHMLRQGSLATDEIAPFGLTQPGMVTEIGASQSAVSNVLKRLAVAGVVASSTRHVVGHPRRLRVYTLTPYGYELARDLQRRRPPSFAPR